MKEDTKEVLGILLQNHTIHYDTKYLCSGDKSYTYREILDEVQSETEEGLRWVANIKKLQAMLANKKN